MLILWNVFLKERSAKNCNSNCQILKVLPYLLITACNEEVTAVLAAGKLSKSYLKVIPKQRFKLKRKQLRLEHQPSVI